MIDVLEAIRSRKSIRANSKRSLLLKVKHTSGRSVLNGEPKKLTLTHILKMVVMFRETSQFVFVGLKSKVMEEFKHLFNADEINEVLDNKHTDPYPKEIGDRVSIIDFSSCTHINGQELDYEDDDQMNFNFVTEFIVIETRQNYQHDAYYKTYRQDLVIVNPLTNKRFRINRGHVTLK